jgi:hypothetical protein
LYYLSTITNKTPHIPEFMLIINFFFNKRLNDL